MPQYQAPLNDMQFMVFDLLKLDKWYQQIPKWSEVTPDLMQAIITEGAKFSDNVVAPTNNTGDEQGCQLNDGVVTTPTGFKEAYNQHIEGGWGALSGPEQYGGQGLPESLHISVKEMSSAANTAWNMYPGLTHSANMLIEAHGTEEQKQTYLPNMMSGVWSGTMCLTEAHCGSDLGILRSKAEPNADGSYNITGNKIFISAGEQDLTENIIHLVLARLPDAPEGTKGISLFIVPKFLVNQDGSLGERNAVVCTSIEHKMGINGSATCALAFDQAKGYLIGEANRGLNCMFTMMNSARLGTGMQAVALASLAYQGSLDYARERLQMRSLSGPKNPEKPADPIIVHPDIRRMLLTQKAFVEGNRALAYYCGWLLDVAEASETEEDRQRANTLLGFLTPICKAFATETSFESVNHGVQIFGGHGYIKEWGMEQIVRDCRITMIYEGTTGIQALDLLGRKVLRSQGKELSLFVDELKRLCETVNENEPALKKHSEVLLGLADEWFALTGQIGANTMKNLDELGASSVDYLMYSGYVILGYFWLNMAAVASQKIQKGEGNSDFYQAKIHTAKFYFERILPRTKTLAETMVSGSDNLMDLSEEHFAL